MHRKRSSNEGTYHLKENGVLVTDKKKVAEIFNNYFSLIQNVGEEHDSDSNVAVVISVHPIFRLYTVNTFLDFPFFLYYFIYLFVFFAFFSSAY